MSHEPTAPGRSLVWALALVQRLPLVGVAISLVLLVVLIAIDAEPWRLGLVGAGVATAITLAVVLRRLIRTPGLVSLPATVAFVAAVFGVQTLVITATGGIESPLIVIYIPASILVAVALGRPRAWLASIALPLTALIGLTLADLLAPEIPLVLPVIDRDGAGSAHVAGISLFALLIALTVVFGGLLGAIIRHRLDRAWQAATASQAALADTLRERNAELVGLAGAIAHELKNPLAAISGLSVLLARKAAPGSREAEQLDVLVGEAKRMGRVLEEFLNFSRPLSDIAVTPTSLTALLRDVVAIHEGLAERAGVKVRLAAPADVVLACDPRKVRQVVTNLLQNALEASPAGGTITVSLEPEPGGGAHVSVDDAGSGLAPGLAEQVFRPGVTTKGGGSGLGLTVARSIAEQHGGGVALSARPGGGCRATLTLPASAATDLAPQLSQAVSTASA
jgi:signal transduction histidine kinase